eukprot:scaffold1511_cov354-Pavlova_lutheri.AAC.2
MHTSLARPARSDHPTEIDPVSKALNPLLGRSTTGPRGRRDAVTLVPPQRRETVLRFLGNDVVCETDRQLGSWDGVGREDAERGALLPGGIANVRPSCALGRRVWW